MTPAFGLVALPLPLAQPYTYRIPESLADRLEPGARVVVRVRQRELVGILVGLTDEPPAQAARDILAVPDDTPALAPLEWRSLWSAGALPHLCCQKVVLDIWPNLVDAGWMLDAIRVAGRWVSKSLLERLTAQSQGPQAPTRRSMLREFCRLTHWVDRKGRQCVSSANVGIGRLEKLGLVQFPPPAPSKARSSPRKLKDDGLALPPLPQLPNSVERIEDLRVHLIANERDPFHPLWNRLISREHPLRGAPLVGAQLRYLLP